MNKNQNLSFCNENQSDHIPKYDNDKKFVSSSQLYADSNSSCLLKDLNNDDELSYLDNNLINGINSNNIQNLIVNFIIDEVKKRIDIDEITIKRKAIRVSHYLLIKYQQEMKEIQEKKLKNAALSLAEQLIEEVNEENSRPASRTFK